MSTAVGTLEPGGREPSPAAPPRRVLVVWYSQTGQLRRAAEALARPLEEAGFEVVWEELEPVRDYPFPWSLGAFLRVFPDAVSGGTAPLRPPAVDRGEPFDLVVIAYQVWFLAPSTPVQALFESELGAVLDGAPVVTLVACRNMWYSAAARMRRLIDAAGGVHVGHVAVTDDGPAWATFLTTPRWLLTGRRDRFLRIFPPAGVGEGTIAGLARFGRRLVARMGRLGEAPPFADLEPYRVEEPMVVADVLGALAFRPWAELMVRAGEPGEPRREALTWAFGAWLVLTVPVAVPALALARLPLRRVVDGVARRYVDGIAAGVAAKPLERRAAHA